jgi:hypothetical protein
MEEGVGLFELGDGLLESGVFGLDVVVLLLEGSVLLAGEGEGLALGLQTTDGF